MFKDAWNSRFELAQAERDEWRRQANAADESVLELVDRMVESKNSSVLKALEAKIEKLEREKIALVEKASEPLPNAGKFEECIELSLRFLSRPWDIYKNGSYAVRQAVLRLASSEPLRFMPGGVYGTAKTTLPFKVLGGLSGKRCEMVQLERETWNSLFETLHDWELQLRAVETTNTVTQDNNPRCGHEHFGT